MKEIKSRFNAQNESCAHKKELNQDLIPTDGYLAWNLQMSLAKN